MEKVILEEISLSSTELGTRVDYKYKAPEILQKYIDHQCNVIIRRTQFDLKKAQERAHILDGLRKAIDIVDEIIATIRACKGGQAEAKTAIMEKFDFDEVQAAAIVAFRLGQLAGLEILKITNELNELREKIKDFEEIVELDTQYIDRWNVLLDFQIIFKTAIQVLFRRGAC